MRRLPRTMLPVPVSARDLSDGELETIILGGDAGRTTPLPRRRSERLPICPPHLNRAAAAEWRRIAKALQRAAGPG